jgi:heterodisulfide reductase subunit A-like polyferredoxin
VNEPGNDRITIEVNTELCLCCGACAQACDLQAIWFLWGRAMINQNRCSMCGRCIEACGQAAIEEKRLSSEMDGS